MRMQNRGAIIQTHSFCRLSVATTATNYGGPNSKLLSRGKNIFSMFDFTKALDANACEGHTCNVMYPLGSTQANLKAAALRMCGQSKLAELNQVQVYRGVHTRVTT